jgi:hypothetical protein
MRTLTEAQLRSLVKAEMARVRLREQAEDEEKLSPQMIAKVKQLGVDFPDDQIGKLIAALKKGDGRTAQHNKLLADFLVALFTSGKSVDIAKLKQILAAGAKT